MNGQIVITCVGKVHYLFNAYFWLDLLAAVSLLGDVPFIATELLGNSFAAARAGRARFSFSLNVLIAHFLSEFKRTSCCSPGTSSFPPPSNSCLVKSY